MLSVYFLINPPLFPLKQNVFNLSLFLAFAALIKFLLLPEVVNAIAMSPLFPRLSICLEKISSNS